MSGRTATKVFMPHPISPDCSIAGILEQLEPEQPTHGRKIALILHGTMGHKDYLFQKKLASLLPVDSFRFDFRGNHETPGTWRQGALQDDVIDLQVVVDRLKTAYGYVIDLIVGHSRGSVVGLRWICTSEVGKTISAFVNVSGRYRMRKIYEAPTYAQWVKDFETQGFHVWNVTVARKELSLKIYPQDLEDFATWDTSLVWNQFPPNVNVLSLHGLADKTVPPYDAVIYARALGNRNPGIHTLHLMEEADHNFTGRHVEVAEMIADWFVVQQSSELKTGVWNTGLRGKL